MVGEIRDQDTANIATQAALTGHLVLSTLHTNDAPGAVTRLIDLNVPPFLVSASLIAVLAQRLVRKVCPNCKEDYEPPAAIKKTVEKWSGEIEKFYRGIGCRKCRNTGYLGRMAIHELLVPDEQMLDMITQGATLKQLRSAALEIGMVPLHIDGMEKVRAGITTIDEVIRVTNLSG
jgi:type IV pilus assembly protein PilB